LATQAQVNAGILDNIAVAPNTMKTYVNSKTGGASKPMRLIQTFNASGTFTLATHGLAIGDNIDFYIVGGGGGAGR